MDNGNISINVEHGPSIPNLKIISISGTMDSINCRQVDEKVFPVIDQEQSNIILDLSSLDYISSTGALCLMKYVASISKKKRLLKIVKPPKPVYDSLVVAGFVKRLDMYDTIEAAMNTLR